MSGSNGIPILLEVYCTIHRCKRICTCTPVLELIKMMNMSTINQPSSKIMQHSK